MRATKTPAAAAALWGGTLGRLVAARENAVYEIALPGGARGALRLHRAGYQSEAAIGSELWLCAALAERGVPVAVPVPLPDGALVGRVAGGCASVTRWCDGVPLGAAGVPLAGDGAAQEAVHRRLGAVLAQMHGVADTLRLPEGFARPDWSREGLVGEAPVWGRFWAHPALSTAERVVMGAVREYLDRVLEEAGWGADYGLIHADVLRENVLLRGGAGVEASGGGISGKDEAGVTLIDFDDCGFGFRLYDLGTVLSQNLNEPHLARIVGGLVEGYAVVRPLGAAQRALIPAFTLARCCASVGWAAPRLPPESPVHRSHIDRALRLGASVLAGRGFG